MQHYPFVRTIYLYLFSLLGLVLLIVAGVRFLDMGLKVFVFTKADEEQRFYKIQPPMPIAIEKIQIAAGGKELSEDERNQMKRFLADYEKWQNESDKFDPVKSQRQRDASFNLAMIIIGLPLYLYHWRIIKKETINRI
ncbi:MAG: hypothetical protein Q7R75_00260 [bacterium]|nr:hypothetical protein [bacterium]